MKPLKTSLTALLFLTLSISFAQVQIDKPIQLTGGTGQRVITNLELPVNGTDAVNKDYVDAAVAASGGADPTMISDESPSAINFGAATRYCNTLNEGGFQDWRLPETLELIKVISTGGVTVSNSSSANIVWVTDGVKHQRPGYSDSYTGYQFSTGVFSVGTVHSSSSKYVRCVR